MKTLRLCNRCVVFVFLLNPIFVFADDAPVIPTQSGSVLPYHEELIRMDAETIDIYLGHGDYRVKVEYTFTNTGQETEISMGFPNQSDWMYGTTIADFRAWVDGEEQEIYRQPGRATTKPYGPYSAPDHFYEVFNTAFTAGQTRTVRNEYSQQYVYGYDQMEASATYILTTGAYWKDAIGSLVVNVHYDRPIGDLRARAGLFESYSEGAEFDFVRYDAIEIAPQPTGTIADGVQIVMEKIDPDFDVEISMPSPVISAVSADSVLRDDRHSYDPSNVLDNDPATSWVEGESDGGVGRTLDLYLSSSIGGGKLAGHYMVEAIGMINGYAANDTLYFANNQVRTAHVEYYSALESDARGAFDWVLDQTPVMQYYRFPAPVPMSGLSIEIADIFPGSRWNDTCIAEIVVVPAALD